MATTPNELTNTPLNGLTEAEVNQRRSQRLGNKAPSPTGRTYAQIFREDILTFINTVILTLVIALVFAGRPSRLVL